MRIETYKYIDEKHYEKTGDFEVPEATVIIVRIEHGPRFDLDFHNETLKISGNAEMDLRPITTATEWAGKFKVNKD